LKPLKIDAPQISTWRRANLIVWAPPEQGEQALSLRVLAIEMAQAVAEPTMSPGWKGHLLIIFDPHTETLVHHFLKLNRTAEVSADWILYVLAWPTGRSGSGPLRCGRLRTRCPSHCPT
jgi:hypothetical protein